MNTPLPSILTRIVQSKKQWLAHRKAQQPLDHFLADIIPSDRDFHAALTAQPTTFILECKKASPSKGLIRQHFDLKEIAEAYRPYAAAISVLTDEHFFQGSVDYLNTVRAHVHQPVLCKDFIIDEYQIYLARYYQADAILLMLSVLDDETYRTLHSLAHELHMGVLTEVINEDELARAIALGAKVIGINNRNLHDLTVDLDRTRRLAPLIPRDRIIVSESGILIHHDVRTLTPFVNTFLIGSALMAEENLPLAVRRIILGDNKVCGLTRPHDAIAAYQAGAVYGGLIFADTSPRYLTPEIAQTLIAAAPLHWVGIFKDATIETIRRLAHQLSLFAVQLHSDKQQLNLALLREVLPATCQIWLAQPVMTSLPALSQPYVDRIVLDNGNGGTGKCWDWSLLCGLPDTALSSLLLAGGVTIANVDRALTFGCAGIDMNSGVESAPGIKDHEKITAMFSHLRLF